jgi:hypothetical protein
MSGREFGVNPKKRLRIWSNLGLVSTPIVQETGNEQIVRETTSCFPETRFQRLPRKTWKRKGCFWKRARKPRIVKKASVSTLRFQKDGVSFPWVFKRPEGGEGDLYFFM